MRNTKKNIGSNIMAKSTVAICSIVRDCNKSLKKNIPEVELLRSKFKDSQVIVFENDSTDGTKETLLNWSSSSENVLVKCQDFNQITIPKSDSNGYNKYFSFHRISKMAGYRNDYLSTIKKSKTKFDFVIVIDLDIASFSIEGIENSFSLANQWDAVTSYGYSFSPSLKKRYHDSYALIEVGNDLRPQTEDEIYENQRKWAFLRSGQPLIPVFSAFGGLAIYKFDAIYDKEYFALENQNDKVQVKCEHYSIYKQMHEAGFTRVFINPNMQLKYQNIDFELIKKSLSNKFKNSLSQ